MGCGVDPSNQGVDQGKGRVVQGERIPQDSKPTRANVGYLKASCARNAFEQDPAVWAIRKEGKVRSAVDEGKDTVHDDSLE